MTPAAVFIDKDGTLVEDVPYNVDPAHVRLTARAGEALRLLQDAGYALVIVTNQPGIGEGRFEADALTAVRARIEALLAPHEVTLSGFYFCPHAAGPEAGCDCRKPAPGLLRRAAADLRVDLTSSWMIGDILHDVEAGRRAGCRTVLIDCGNETQWDLSDWRFPDAFARDLHEAARLILSLRGRRAEASAAQ